MKLDNSTSCATDNMRRAPCCDKNGLKKGPWTTEEDAMLVNYIQKHGPGNWRNFPKNAGLQRCGKSCRLRWTNYLRPDIKRGRLLRMGIDPVTHALRIDLLYLSSILSSYVCNNPAAALLNLSNLLNSTQQQQPLVNPELLRLADWTGLAVFPARKDCALASFKTKFSATPFVDELDESEKSVAHTASLHTAPCVDLFLKKHERTDGASVLFGVKLRTSTPLVYDLGPEKSTGCIGAILARKDCALALLGATPLEEFQESEKSALQTQIKIVLQDGRTDRVAVIWAPKGCGVDGFFAVALSDCKKVLVLDDPEYVTIDQTSSQDKRFMLLKKTNVSNSANQHKYPTRSQGREISSSSCNAIPIVTDDIAVTERILWLPIKHGARVSQKDKLGLTFFFVILLLGWIPGVNAADENALLQGCTCTWICIIIGSIALVYFAYKIYSLPPPEPYLFSEKVLVLDDPEYVTIDQTSSQDKCFMLLKKTSVSNSANQHKCPARSQGREIFSSSCNALPIVTKDDDVTESSRILWLPSKHGARVSQKDKLGLTFFFAILLPGWIPVVNAVDENAFLRGTISTCTWFWIIIITIASAYCAYTILRRSPPEPYLFSEKVRIWINGEMNVKVYDDEGILVGSWRCALSTANGDAVDITEWVTNLLNFVLEIHVPQEDGRVKEISFNQMDDPEFIGMPKDVYLHNPDTGLLRYIGRSVPQNGAPSDRDILRAHTNVYNNLLQF